MIQRLFVILTLSLVTSGFAIPYVSAGTQAAIKIEQLSASSFGTWTLLSANGSSRTSKDKGVDVTGGFTAALTEFGQTTLTVTAPAGMSVSISVYHGGDLVKEVTSNQYSFPLYTNDNYRFVIKYSLSRTGSLGVTSEPGQLRFRMKGPTSRNYSAVTPFTFKELPAGKYSLYFPKTQDCLQPAVQTIDVQPGQRNTTNVSLTCNVAAEENVDRSRVSKRTLFEYVQTRETKTRGQRK